MNKISGTSKERIYCKKMTPLGISMVDTSGVWQDVLGASPWTAEEDIVVVGVELDIEMCAMGTAEGQANAYAEISQTPALNTDGCIIRGQAFSNYEEIATQSIDRGYVPHFRTIWFPSGSGIPVSEGANLCFNVHHQVSPSGSGYTCSLGVNGIIYYMRK